MIPLSRLRTRLGLDKYNVSAPVTEFEYVPKKLTILLSQHIGAPAKTVVAVGDKVTQGQVIATACDNVLSVNIHAPVNGKVIQITDKKIVIGTEENK